jgi:transposase-like protein
VQTEIGPVQLEVPRDRDASFQPKIVRKRQRRLTGVDDLVVSLVAKGLTTGEVAAHLAEVCGTQVSRQTISTITDRVLEGLGEWQNRPLDAVYPVIFIDAIHVKIRDGQVRNRPIYVVLGVSVDGERDILPAVGRQRRRGRQVLAARAHRGQQPRRGRCVHRGLRRPAGTARRHRHGVAQGGDPDVRGASAAR